MFLFLHYKYQLKIVGTKLSASDLTTNCSASTNLLNATEAVRSYSPVPHLSKIWNSIKNFTSDNTQSTAISSSSSSQFIREKEGK